MTDENPASQLATHRSGPPLGERAGADDRATSAVAAPAPRRVMVVGCAGAGKSTITVALNRAHGLPIVHLDRLYWKPGWQRSPDDEWELVLRELVAEDAWIHDGNYDSTMDFRLPRADLVVFVDTPRRRCLYRAVKRRLVGNRIHDIPGCPENLDREFFGYVWRFPTVHRPRLLERLAGHPNVVRLRTRREVRRFLAGLAAPSPG
ncbi:hypothetical protein [Stackebrandtia nassauensis]|nr:hypothetical protein [Stackebrandtia nassauensis]